MDRRLLIVLCLFLAALGTWFVLGGGGARPGERGWRPALESDPQGAAPSSPHRPLRVDPSPRADGLPEPPPDATAADGAAADGAPGDEAPVGPPTEVFMPEAAWTDAPARTVLKALAAAAGRRLVLEADAPRRLRGVRVTLAEKDATVARLLDLVLAQGKELGWTTRGRTLVIYVDDE